MRKRNRWLGNITKAANVKYSTPKLGDYYPYKTHGSWIPIVLYGATSNMIQVFSEVMDDMESALSHSCTFLLPVAEAQLLGESLQEMVEAGADVEISQGRGVRVEVTASGTVSQLVEVARRHGLEVPRLARPVKLEQLALVNEFSDKTAPKIFGGDLKQHNLLFAAKSAADYDTVIAQYSEAAKGFKGKLLFVLVDCDVDDNKRVMEFFGITDESCPTMRVINMEKNMAKFAPEKDDLSSDAITAFVNGVLDGSIARHLKSEEIPDNSNNAVKVVVGKNFEELVKDPTKNVFVEFYAPWCGHCKSLAPIWDELGEKYKDHENIVIAKSDATANEFADVEVQGFPTLKFFPAGEGAEMQDYNGGRTLDDFVKFLEPEAAEEAADAKDEL